MKTMHDTRKRLVTEMVICPRRRKNKKHRENKEMGNRGNRVRRPPKPKQQRKEEEEDRDREENGRGFEEVGLWVLLLSSSSSDVLVIFLFSTSSSTEEGLVMDRRVGDRRRDDEVLIKFTPSTFDLRVFFSSSAAVFLLGLSEMEESWIPDVLCNYSRFMILKSLRKRDSVEENG